MSLRVGVSSFVLVAVTALLGCDGPPDTVVGSDVPQIVGLENRHSSGLEHDGDTLVAGRFLYRGTMRDPVDVANHTIERYRRFGWTLVSQRIQPTSAALVFTKDDRRVEVDLKTNMLNHTMGAGAIDLHRAGTTAAGAQVTGGHS